MPLSIPEIEEHVLALEARHADLKKLVTEFTKVVTELRDAYVAAGSKASSPPTP